jgi:glycosyltransferase involved in cell wall biosynthesis
LEALACGTPILVSDVGAAQEFRSDEATIIVSSSGSTELAAALEAIVTLARLPGVREAARAIAQQFPWERTAKELLRVARRVAARSG